MEKRNLPNGLNVFPKPKNILRFTGMFMLVFFAWAVQAQQGSSPTQTNDAGDPVIRCHTMEVDAQMRELHPEFGSLEDMVLTLKNKDDNQASGANGSEAMVVSTLPIIFHVIHDNDAVGSGDNLAAIYINAQITQANNDFRKVAGTSGDNNNPVGADAEVDFCAALVDPSGAALAEPGINRIDRNTQGWTAPPYTSAYINATIKPASQWDPTKYCNVWVMELSGGLLGYAQFPDNSGLPGLNPIGGAANTDGIVCKTTSIGSTTVPNPGGGVYNAGRTFTHEAGHWLGLRHIWGDGNCSVDDFCADTPNAGGSNFGCPAGTDSCPDPGVDMIENYMDYTDDACMNIVTVDQKARIQTVLAVSPRRMELATSTACSIVACDLAITGIVVSPGATCGNTGTIDITATTSNPPITYSISGPVNMTNATGSFSGLPAGSYIIQVVDAFPGPPACTATGAATLLGDTQPPVITCPANLTIECDASTAPANTGTATAIDNCDPNPGINFTDVVIPGNCPQESTINRTWTATDASGNMATCTQVITVDDSTPPVITCPANVTIQCDASTAPANNGSATAIDNCDTSVIPTFADVSTQTASGCGQYNYVITRTWTATDDCGNASTCTQIITVEDTTPPVITCPASITIECTASTDPANTGTATATDNCSAANEINITSTDISTRTNTGCGQFQYMITRTWVATDVCGNTSTCVQIINVVDTTPPVITCAPGQTLTCFESVPNPINTAAGFIAAGGTISDNCTAVLSDFTVFSTQVDNGGSNCPGDARIVTRTYYVLDACGNSTTCTQTFTYLESTQGPVITSILPTCYKYCGSLANPADSDITYTTDCSFGATVNITGPTIIGTPNCPGTIYRFTYTVTDDCGRTSAPVTRDFIIGNDGPTIQCPSYSLLLECGDANNSAYINEHLSQVSANTSCELGYTITHFPSNFNNITCNTATVVTFVATDDCGRTATCTTVINISDNTAPVITSTYVDGVCNEAICGSNLNFWFANWKSKVLEGLSATDACDSNIQWTTSPNSNSPNQDCPDGTAETTVTWFANDNCGNAGEISYTFYVVPAQGPDPAGQIMGIVANEESETVEDVVVSLEGNGNEETFQTLADGIYNFADLQLEENYTVTPYLDQDHLNGVSSFDLVLIAKHILQSQLLDSPYKIIAADINKSGSVTTIDIVELRKLILHINEEFPNNTSWRFIESAFVFPEPTNPFATIFPEAVYINGLTEDEQHDFVGVKVGDVNGSAVANAMAAAEDRTVVDDLVFQIADQQLKAGQSYEVTFHADNFEAVHGYQFSLNFDEAVLKFANISAGELTNLDESNFGLTLLEKGVITTSWTNQEAQSLARNAEVFHLTFVAKADALLSEVISVSSRYTKAEAYNGNMDLMDVQLRFDGDDIVTNQFRLYQNTPNPFKQETVIGFDLPEASKATLMVYDISGKLLTQVEGDFVKGYNSISLSNDGLSPGLLHYQLVTPTGTATMKMILQ